MLALSLLTAALLITNTPARKLEEILKDAEQTRQAGDWTRTLELLQEAYAVSPRPELVNNIGRALEALGRYREAVEAYRRVADDPRADPALRALDAARIAALKPKLQVTELVTTFHPPATLRIDGSAVAAGETQLERGSHVFELFDESLRQVVLRIHELPLGERVQLRHADLGVRADDAHLIFGADLERIAIDGYVLRADPAKVHDLALTPGPHAIELTRLGKTRTSRLELRSGERIAIDDLLGEPAQPRLDPVAVAQPAPEESSLDLPPLLLAAGGAAAAAVAVGLRVSATSDRDTIRDAPIDERGFTVGLTYRRADELENSADRKATAALVLTAAGTGMLAGALIWWLIE